MYANEQNMREYLKYAFYGMVELNNIPKDLMNNKEFVLKLANQKGVSAILVCYISEELKNDFDVISTIILNHNINKYGFTDKRDVLEYGDSNSEIIKGSRCHYTKMIGEDVLKNRKFWDLLNEIIKSENDKIEKINEEKGVRIRPWFIFDVDSELSAVEKYFEQKKQNKSKIKESVPTLSDAPKRKIYIIQTIYGYEITNEEAYEYGFIEKPLPENSKKKYKLSYEQVEKLKNMYDVNFEILKYKIKIFYAQYGYFYADAELTRKINIEDYTKLKNNILLEVEEVLIQKEEMIHQTLVNIYFDNNNNYYLDGRTAYYLNFSPKDEYTKYYKLSVSEYMSLKKNPYYEIKQISIRPYVIFEDNRRR